MTISRWWVCHCAPPGARVAPRRRRSRSAAAPGGARRPRRHRALPGAPWPRLRARPTAPGTAQHGSARSTARLASGHGCRLGWAGLGWAPALRTQPPARPALLAGKCSPGLRAQPRRRRHSRPPPALLIFVTDEAGSTRKGLLIKTYVNTEKKLLKIVHYIVLTVTSKLYLYRLTGTFILEALPMFIKNNALRDLRFVGRCLKLQHHRTSYQYLHYSLCKCSNYSVSLLLAAMAIKSSHLLYNM